jgi:hypothetical protein
MPVPSHETAQKSNREAGHGTDGASVCYYPVLWTKQSKRLTKPIRRGGAAKRKRSWSIYPATNFGGRVMTTKTSIAKYLLIRTAAFVGLTAVSTAVMALPYLA